MTDLAALRSSDFETLQKAYQSLKDDVYRICFPFLAQKFPTEIEDVASEATADIFAEVSEIKDAKGLATLTKSIAENQAINRYVKMMAKKRGAGETESLEATRTDDDGTEKRVHEPASGQTVFDVLDVKDIRTILQILQEELKPEHKMALYDFFILGLSQDEIREKRGWPKGSVGVYVKRGLDAMRKQRLKYPALTSEAALYIMMMLA